MSASQMIDMLDAMQVLNQSRMTASVLRAHVAQSCAHGMSKADAIEAVAELLPVSTDLAAKYTYSTRAADFSPIVTELLRVPPPESIITVYRKGYAHLNPACVALLGLTEGAYSMDINMDARHITLHREPERGAITLYKADGGIWTASMGDFMASHGYDPARSIYKFHLTPDADAYSFVLLEQNRA